MTSGLFSFNCFEKSRVGDAILDHEFRELWIAASCKKKNSNILFIMHICTVEQELFTIQTLLILFVFQLLLNFFYPQGGSSLFYILIYLTRLCCASGDFDSSTILCHALFQGMTIDIISALLFPKKRWASLCFIKERVVSVDIR